MHILPRLTIFFFLFPMCLTAQTDSVYLDNNIVKKEKKSKKPTLFEHLSSDPSITEVTLTTNMDSLIDNKFKDIEVPSVYAYQLDGKDYNWNVKISPRGKSRKTICEMPPYLLNFQRDELKDQGVKRKHDKLKMVNFCKNGKRFDYYLFREYLIYKIYNIITDNSFKVKLIHVNYVDAQGDYEPDERYSFLIEDTDEMADRLKAKEVNKYDVSPDSCSSYDYDVLSMFQFMISNTDWNIQLLHNTKLIKKKKTGEIIVVPYDFDYSGLVNAEYSVPNPDYVQFGVRHRVYIGDYPTDEEVAKVIELYQSKEQEIYQLINDFELLDKGWRKDMNKFIRKFYKLLKNPKKLKKKCKPRKNDYRGA